MGFGVGGLVAILRNSSVLAFVSTVLLACLCGFGLLFLVCLCFVLLLFWFVLVLSDFGLHVAIVDFAFLGCGC